MLAIVSCRRSSYPSWIIAAALKLGKLLKCAKNLGTEG